jgi:dihydrofolate synthase/folylpolyglutamate synthase
MLFIIFQNQITKGLDATILAQKQREHGLTGTVFNSITTAYQNALEAAKDADLIYIGGSTFVVAEIL